MQYERDLRQRESTLWLFINDWVLQGVHAFMQHSLGMIDAADSRTATISGLASTSSTVFDDVIVLKDRCRSVEDQLARIANAWEAFHQNLELYAESDMPREDRPASLVGSFMSLLLGTPEASPISQPGDFPRLISLSEQIRLQCQNTYATTSDLASFLETLLNQFSQDELNAEWAAKLDLGELRERWKRIEEDVIKGRSRVVAAPQRIQRLSGLDNHACG